MLQNNVNNYCKLCELWLLEQLGGRGTNKNRSSRKLFVEIWEGLRMKKETQNNYSWDCF